MSAVMYRLQSQFNIAPSLPKEDETACEWRFSEELASKSVDFFRPLLKKHLQLSLEYNILCSQIVHYRNRADFDEQVFMRQLASALMMAELLDRLYHDYLHVPREVVRLRNEQLIYRQQLASMGYTFPGGEPQSYDGREYLTQKIRAYTINCNLARLVAGRSKRVLNALAPLARPSDPYVGFSSGMDRYFTPFFTHLSWAFFIPRLKTNLFVLLKHLFPWPSMGTEEKKIPWWIRLHAHWQRRWFEVMNDAPWLVSGLLNAFLFVGKLAPVAGYVNVGFFLYDVIMAAIRYYVETRRLKSLQTQYQAMMEEAGDDPAKREEIHYLQYHLQQRLDFEKWRLMVGILNTSLLLVAIILSMPVLFSINPVFALIGAIISIVVTVATYYAAKEIEKQRPVSNIKVLAPTPVHDESTTPLLSEQRQSDTLSEIGLFGRRSSSDLSLNDAVDLQFDEDLSLTGSI